MKNISLLNEYSKNTLLLFFLSLITISVSSKLNAQSNSPVIQWGKEYNHFQNPSDPVNKNSLDWALQNIQAVL